MNVLVGLLQIIGATLEVVGVILTASQFVSVPLQQIPHILASALVRGELAQGSVEIAKLVGEKPIQFVQGLSLICLGFLVQFFAGLISLYLSLKASNLLVF